MSGKPEEILKLALMREVPRELPPDRREDGAYARIFIRLPTALRTVNA